MTEPVDESGQIFTLDEFVSYLQVPEFDRMTAELARDLATIEIRMAVGVEPYESLTDLTPFKAIALAVAKRFVTNPDGLRSTSIDDYTETYASESLAAAYLTADERSRIDALMGRGGAFTIRPYGTPDVPRPYLYHL